MAERFAAAPTLLEQLRVRFREILGYLVLIGVTVGLIAMCSYLGISLLAAAVWLGVSAALYFIGTKLVPEQYRAMFWIIVVAAGLALVGLIQKGVLPLSAIAVIGGTYASVMEAAAVNIAIILLIIATMVALGMLAFAKKITLPLRKGVAATARRAKPRTAEAVSFA